MKERMIYLDGTKSSLMDGDPEQAAYGDNAYPRLISEGWTAKAIEKNDGVSYVVLLPPPGPPARGVGKENLGFY